MYKLLMSKRTIYLKLNIFSISLKIGTRIFVAIIYIHTGIYIMYGNFIVITYDIHVHRSNAEI